MQACARPIYAPQVLFLGCLTLRAQTPRAQVKCRWLPCRTPADQFFPDDSYSALIDALQEFGEQQLGCRGISPVWLSYYVDGCRQVLPGAWKCMHAGVP